jgi:hypothetical protein
MPPAAGAMGEYGRLPREADVQVFLLHHLVTP